MFDCADSRFIQSTFKERFKFNLLARRKREAATQSGMNVCLCVPFSFPYIVPQLFEKTHFPSTHRTQTSSEGKKKRDVRISFTPTMRIFPLTQTPTVGVDGNEKKVQAIRWQAAGESVLGMCEKGVRVWICDKKWLYGSCTLEYFPFGESMCKL